MSAWDLAREHLRLYSTGAPHKERRRHAWDHAKAMALGVCDAEAALDKVDSLCSSMQLTYMDNDPAWNALHALREEIRALRAGATKEPSDG